MKILYFSDKYTWDNWGTKRSIYEEVKRRENHIIWQDRGSIKKIINLIKIHKPNQIWLSHSNLTISSEVKKKIRIPVVGFGFSDPYNFKVDRLNSYDVYITNHYDTFIKFKNKMPVLYNPTASDFNFHAKSGVEKDMDISIIGTGRHRMFKKRKSRLDIVSRLRKDGYSVAAYGQAWPKHKNNKGFIKGKSFLNIINRSKIGIDIQDENSPLAHRMMEYLSCGTLCITRRREEVSRVFDIGKEIVVYDNYKDLKDKIEYYLNNEEERKTIEKNAMKRCKRDHNITSRVDNIINFVDGIK